MPLLRGEGRRPEEVHGPMRRIRGEASFDFSADDTDGGGESGDAHDPEKLYRQRAGHGERRLGRSVAVCGSDIFPAGGPHTGIGLPLLAVRVSGIRPEHEPAPQALSQDTDPFPFLYQQPKAGRASQPCIPGHEPDPGLYGGGVRRHVFRAAHHDSVLGCDVCDQLENDAAVHGIHCYRICGYQSFLAQNPYHLP